MKKQMILPILSLVVLLFIGFGLYQANQLKEVHIQKTVVIDASLEESFDMVKYLAYFPKWSPFLEVDPTQVVEVKGKDGSVGAQYHWNGNGGKDLGYQEIVAIDHLKSISMRCDIQKPFQAHPSFDYSFEKSAKGVKVIQDFKLESSLVDAFFMWVFGAKGKMENMNARGMQLLKEAVEKQDVSYSVQ